MKKRLYFVVAIVPVVALICGLYLGFGHIGKARASTCTLTGFYRDGFNLTAAVIPTVANPNITGAVNATGCNIGVYYGPGLTGVVNKADIYGANYFGVVNDGGKNVTITKSNIHDIGENPFNGSQHGVAIYFSYDSGATGTVSNNHIWYYQKSGIVVNGPSDSAKVTGNSVTGLGPINFIAQNGIQIGYGARAYVTYNTVTNNSYTGSYPASDGGIIALGGSCYGSPEALRTTITGNTVIGNDIGLWVSDIDVDPNNPNNCVPTTVVTKVVVNSNSASNDYITNTAGDGNGFGYQAGIVDQGNKDSITNNSICGAGYTYNPAPPPYLYSIDVTATNNPTVSGNTLCNGNPIPPITIKGAKKHPQKHFTLQAFR